MLPLAFVVTGVPAIIIILVVLAIIVLGVVRLLQLGTRGVKRVSDKATGREPRG